MRAFLAIPLTAAAGSLAEAAARSLGDAKRWRWVARDDLHITLCFLGEIDSALLPELDAGLGAVAARQAPFEIVLAHSAAYPSTAAARVLVLEAQDAAGELGALAEDVRSALGPRFGETRPYRGHLTLGRVRGRPVPVIARPLPQPLRIWADRIMLFETLPPGPPPRYAPRATWRLTGRRP